MTSIEEKKVIGTYRSDRHSKYDIQLNGDKIIAIEPPNNLTPAVLSTWNDLIPYLCNLGLIYKQDTDTLYQAFSILTELEAIEADIKKLSNKQKLNKNFAKYIKLAELKLKYIKHYNDIMANFFVSPKERLKAIQLFVNTEVKKEELEDDFI